MEVCDDEASADVVLVAWQALMERSAPSQRAPMLAYGEEECPKKAADALACGAYGYFALSSDPPSLRAAIESVSNGRVWATHEALPLLANGHREDDLDSQQRILLSLLHEGLTNKEIASRSASPKRR